MNYKAVIKCYNIFFADAADHHARKGDLVASTEASDLRGKIFEELSEESDRRVLCLYYCKNKTLMQIAQIEGHGNNHNPIATQLARIYGQLGH